MKRIFTIALSLLLSACATAEAKYIEITQTQNLPLFRVKRIEDFETIISRYGTSLIFIQYQPPSSTAFVIGDNTYFSFNLEGYETIADFKLGKSLNYKNSQDYEKGKALGFDKSETYYFYAANQFNSAKDCLSALVHKFPDSYTFYDAQNKGYAEYTDYKEYLEFSALGFTSKAEYQSAKSKGFQRGEEYRKATEAGFLNSEEYKQALLLGFYTKAEYSSYTAILASLDKIVSEKKFDKKTSIIYYYLQKIAKGDQSINVLSTALISLWQQEKTEIKEALNVYINDMQTLRDYQNAQNNRRYYGNRTINIQDFFVVDELK